MNLIAALFALVLTALITTTTLQRIDESLFHPVILVNAIVSYYILLPAWFLILTSRLHFGHANPQQELIAAITVTVAFYAITIAVYRQTTSLDSLPHTPNCTDVSRNVLLVIGGVGFFGGVFFYLVYVFINGGFIRLLTITPRTAFTGADTARYKFLTYAGLFAGLVTICTAYRPTVLRQDLTQPDKLILVGTAATVFGIVLSLRSRMNIVIPAGYLLLYFDTTNRLPRRKLAQGACVLLAVGMSYTFAETLFTARASDPTRIITAGIIDTIRLEVFMKVIDAVPDTHPYQWGATIVHALGIRWSEMPASYGNQLQQIALGRETKHVTFPAMLLGELWLNYGVVGVLLGGSGLGWALKKTAGLLHSANYLIAGPAPVILLGVLAMLPTSLTWGLRSMWLRVLLPVAVAIGIARVVTEHTQTHRHVSSRERL